MHTARDSRDGAVGEKIENGMQIELQVAQRTNKVEMGGKK